MTALWILLPIAILYISWLEFRLYAFKMILVEIAKSLGTTADDVFHNWKRDRK